MNILLAVPWSNLEPEGGVNVVVRTLGSQFIRAGDHVVYLLPGRGSAVREEALDGGKLYHVPMRRPQVDAHLWRSRFAFLLYFPLTCWRLAKILRRENIQVVNLHYFMDLWIYFLFLRSFMSFRLAISLHGSDVLGASAARNLRMLGRWSGSIDRVVFCSEGFRRQILSAQSELNAKSRVVLNGVDCGTFPAEQRGNGNRAYVICVAHLREHKAQDVLLRAFRRLSEEFPSLELDLVGEGPFQVRLEELVRQLQLFGKVNFYGVVPRKRVLELIRDARIFCLPSRREPFGLVLLEAMAMRTPLVATRVGGIPEIVRDGLDGLLVPPDDAEALAHSLRKVLVDENLRSALEANGVQRVHQDFSVSRFASDYRACLFGTLREG